MDVPRRKRESPSSAIGKIHDIYNGRGVGRLRHNQIQHRWHGKKLTAALQQRPQRPDLLQPRRFRHAFTATARDLEGFRPPLSKSSTRKLAPYLKLLGERDLLLITADHGCDPRPSLGNHRSFPRIRFLSWPTTPRAQIRRKSRHPGPRFADMGQTIAQKFRHNYSPRHKLSAGVVVDNVLDYYFPETPLLAVGA